MGEKSLSAGSSLKSAALLELMNAYLQTAAGDDLKEKIGLIYQFNIAPTKIGIKEEKFTVDLKEKKVIAGASDAKPDATFSFADADFMAVATGKLNPQMAFIRGKMKIKGSMKAAQKFTPDIFPKPSKL
eukprot:TRINITY_DN4631_c0_g1_i1.p1 TRINITY_DN4631_c0_g1~~TRINITY_DN4631_c0_g1_i1.p1  ORF type:complete len:129 (-),score=28.83 TRINITY_DN4631_c0_g1_i1:168-554(-)